MAIIVKYHITPRERIITNEHSWYVVTGS